MNSEGESAETNGGAYVHRPGSVDDAGGREPDGESDTAVADTGAAVDRHGWALVGVVVLCFLVIPGVIYLWPAAPADAGLSFLVAMLVLPMAPALLLGLTAVWSLAAGRDEES